MHDQQIVDEQTFRVALQEIVDRHPDSPNGQHPAVDIARKALGIEPPEVEFTTERYPDPDWERLGVLNQLLKDGLIEVRSVWCSEYGIMPPSGHFHGEDAVHVPDTFGVVTSPPLAERLRRKQVPITFTLPIRKPDDEA